jgi:hypothetical protein
MISYIELDKDKFYIKIVDLDLLYDFEVSCFFIRDCLEAQMLMSSY